LEDKWVLELIRREPLSEVMVNDEVVATEEETAQGGALSPRLSNKMLDDLDKELEKRGFRLADTPSIFEWVDLWLRPGLRQLMWKRRKRAGSRFRELPSLGMPRERTALGARGKRPGAWRNPPWCIKH
jgi:retron-type reverse transcriptase